MTLIELMIAMIVLMVGITGCMALMGTAIGGNSRNRQQSNSTAIAQMVTEKIMSVPANTSPTLTITDCNGTNNTVFTIGATGGGAGAPLLASGDADFSQAAVANYSMSYATCGAGAGQQTYDVRWNIITLSSNVKLITVSAKLRGAGTDLKTFSLPVTIRTVAGLGT